MFERDYPDDDRPRLAIEATRAWSRGEISVGAAREAAVKAHAAARDAAEGSAARAAARASGQAVSTPHMADHSLGAAAYAVAAVKLASPPPEAAAAGKREHQWQLDHLTAPVRDLVLAALEERTVLGSWTPER
jgi:hypothetical protein